MKKQVLALLLSALSVATTFAQNCTGVPTLTGGGITVPQNCAVNPTLSAIAPTGGTAPYTYSWSAFASGTPVLSTSTSVTNLTPGATYYLVITDQSGCYSPIKTNYTFNRQVPTVSITPNTPTLGCSVPSVSLTVASSTGFVWDNATTTNPRVITQPGTYTVTATNANFGCTSTASITIGKVENQEITSPRDVCYKSRVTLTNGTLSPPIYNDTMIVNSRTPLGAGCFRTETFNVTVRGTKTPTLLNVFVCPGKSTTINGVVYTYANITDGQRVNINTIDAFGCNNTTIYTLRKDTYEPGAPQNAEFCQGGSFTFRGVQYTSTQNVIIPNTGTGCDTLYPIIIRVRPVYVGANTTQNVKTICLGDSITIGNTNTGTPVVHQPTAPGNYDFTDLIKTYRYGCDSTVHTLLTVQPSYTRTGTNDSVRIFRCTNSLPIQIGGINFTTAGTYRGQVVAQTFKGCDSTYNYILRVSDTIAVTKVQYICEGSSLVINGTQQSTPGDYALPTSPAFLGGCDSTNYIRLRIRQKNFTTVVTKCGGETYQIGNITYNDTQGGIITSNLRTWDNACDSILVTDLRFTKITAQPYISYMQCADGRNLGNVVISPTGGTAPYTYVWDNGLAAYPFQSCLLANSYYVTITEASGCATVSVVKIEDIDSKNCLLLNEGFSPDGDFHNETWQIPCIKNETNTVSVYNRWGQLMFQTKDYQGDWDGMVGGKPAPDGTYYYVVITSNFTRRGTLTILRQ